MTPLAAQLIANLGQSPANAAGMNAPLSGANDINQAMVGMLTNMARAQKLGLPQSSPWGGLANIGSNLQGAANWVGNLLSSAGVNPGGG